jgi:glycoprotein-N-acetylgalactosamine 3-beta-galactosyltransferase
MLDCIYRQKCDGFIVASNQTDPSIDAVNILHEGDEEYDNIWQKVRSLWSFIYDHYYEKYDWFYLGGDDQFILMENLRLYLESEEIRTAANGGIYLPDGSETMQTPLYLGRRMAYEGDMTDLYNAGGPGYVMNKAALKTFVVEGLPKYYENDVFFAEDLLVGRVLKNFGIHAYETKDEHGGERFMQDTPGFFYSYRLPPEGDQAEDGIALYAVNIKEGLDHCAKFSIAFHYVRDMEVKRLYALLYGFCSAVAA